MPAGATPRPPTNDETALLVLANQSRSDPAAQGFSEPVVPPLTWSSGLAEASIEHSKDMAANGCYQHNSCSGQSWSSRISRYYGSWTWLGENITYLVNTPQSMHAGWMGSAGHRANILSSRFSEFGSGIAMGVDGFGPVTLTTEDFGSHGLVSLGSIPALPAGAVLPRLGGSEARQLLVNYYHRGGGAPQAVRAIVGNSCVTLDRVSGSATHGTYAAARSFSGGGCVPLVFEAIRSDGARYRFPEGAAILVGAGTGGASCAERTTAVPNVDCDPAGPAPTPTPTPTPNPDPDLDASGDSRLGDVRIVLRPNPAGAGKGSVNAGATLPAIDSFDPTGFAVRIAVRLPNGGEWSRTLPVACDGSACMRGNAGRSVYRMRDGANGPRLTFSRSRNGDWRMRFSSRSEPLGALAAGPVTISVEIGDLTATATVEGELREARLVAE